MDFEALLNLLDKAIEKSAKKLNTKLLELLENGGDLNTAFASFSDEFWADFLKAYNKANGAQLSLGELMNLRANKITLSKALYTELREVKNSVKSVIKTAIKEQKSANELAKMLYEGYDFKADPLKVKRKFPKYLWQKSAKTKVKNIKTPALRASYSKILKDESKLVTKQALKVAGYEKARYYAKRIALNETARAYNDARAFEYANKGDIQVVKIQMSITHPRTDICDYYAGVDKYGLGAGVYPKDKAPVPPFHPFCRCQMIPRYADEYAKPKLNADADKEYLSGLKEWQRARILGSKAKANEALKTGDINSVFNAMKPERYKVKSIDEVAKFQKESDIISPLNKVNEMIFLDKISQNEAINVINNYLKTDLELAKSRRNFIISKNIKQYLKDIFKNENLHSIILSEETLAQHFLKHPEITANDYYFVLKSLAKKPLANFESGKNNQLFYYDNSEKIYYRIAIKATKNDEIFVKSVVKGDEKLKKEIDKMNSLPH